MSYLVGMLLATVLAIGASSMDHGPGAGCDLPLFQCPMTYAGIFFLNVLTVLLIFLGSH